MSAEQKNCSRCGAARVAGAGKSTWCAACHAAYNRARKQAIDAGTWRPTGRAAYPTDQDRITARLWRAKCRAVTRAESALERLRAEAEALKAGFRRTK